MLSWVENASQPREDVRVQVHDESDRQSTLALVICHKGNHFGCCFGSAGDLIMGGPNLA